MIIKTLPRHIFIVTLKWPIYTFDNRLKEQFFVKSNFKPENKINFVKTQTAIGVVLLDEINLL